ncbi:hypothetical protein BSKO_04416 [Bryopsis sp. KO-2023]|nr:hypothetical protein BSKO_04416 [Bryopsis sp. KO-2023]
MVGVLSDRDGHASADHDEADEESELSKVLIDESDESLEGVRQDEDYTPDDVESEEEVMDRGDDSGAEASSLDSDQGLPKFRGPKGKRTSRRPRQFGHVEAESSGEEEYEMEDDASADEKGKDEALARELDFQLNKTSRGRPRRRAARMANRRLQGQLDFDSSEEEPASEMNFPDPPEPSSRRPTRNLHSGGARTSSRTRSSKRAARIDYKESSDGDGEDEGSKRKRIVPALDDGNEELDDEVEKILWHRDLGERNKHDLWASREFYVKWKRWAYIHCSWETRATLSQLKGFKRVVNYIRRHDDREEIRASVSREEMELLDVEDAMEAELVEEHKYAERVVSERRQEDGTLQYLVKWRGLPYSECTWENSDDVFATVAGQDAVDDFKDREQRLLSPSRSVDGQRRVFHMRKDSGVEHHQPGYLRGGTLRDYQLGGLNWLVYSWSKNINCILADEMGLGKTVQCVSFLSYLAETLQVLGPFLVVVPLSTVPNWLKEFRKWAPQMNVVVYVGDTDSREVIKRFEFERSKNGTSNRPYKFEVLITTFDFTLKDAHVLKEIKWNYLLVDEAHRLKNADSSLYQEMEKWSFKNKLLVTGTPLQNTLKELWALLHFLDPDKFPNCEAFEENYSLENPSGLHEVNKLHADLRPHILRRVIKDVEKSLPPKRERILRVEMSPMQRQYYKWVLGKNFEELNKGASGGGHVSLLNIICELKKCCNHPFLFESAAEKFQGSEEDKGTLERIIVTSGKMVLAEKLLTKLKETGHRVLIFSQMVRLLDILSGYLRLKGYQHQRLDGSTPSHQRHQAMEHFNAPNSEDFAFLLSTRAGGLGINLATADTVIIFDSDWNPQNDLQAMSRAHRIGQKDMVNIYRFVTKGTVEEDILERAKKKMVLDHLVIQKMDTSGRTVLESNVGNRSLKKMFAKDELASILRFGAEDLFKVDEAQGAEQLQKLQDEDIDSILERAEVVDNTGRETGASELLNQFQVATFNTVEDDVSFWSKLIPESERRLNEQEELENDAELGPRAARLRAQRKVEQQISSENSDWQPPPKGPPPRISKQPSSKPTSAKSKSKKSQKGHVKLAPPVPGAAIRIDVWTEETAEEASPGNSGNSNRSALGKKDALAFVKACRRFGMKERLPDIVREVGPPVANATAQSQNLLWDSLIHGCESAVEGAEVPKLAILDFFGAPVKAQEFSAHLKMVCLLATQIEALKDPLHFRLDASQLPAAPKWGKKIGWTSRDDAMLLLGSYFHGIGSWEAISNDVRLNLSRKLDGAVNGDAGGALGPKSTSLDARVVALLKKIQAASAAASSRSVPGRPSGRAVPPRGGGVSPLGVSGRPGRVGVKRSLDRSRVDRTDKRKKFKEDNGGKGKLRESDPTNRRHKEASTSGRPPDPHNCEPILEPVIAELRKLHTLKSVNLPVERLLRKTRKYLCTIGEHIEEATKRKPTSIVLHCWDYVSAFAANNKSGEKYHQMYEVIKKEKSAEAANNTQSQASGGNKRKADEGLSGREKAPRASESRRRHRYSPDPDEPSTVCRSVKEYMKIFGDDRDRVQRLEEVNSKGYRKRATR